MLPNDVPELYCQCFLYLNSFDLFISIGLFVVAYLSATRNLKGKSAFKIDLHGFMQIVKTRYKGYLSHSICSDNSQAGDYSYITGKAQNKYCNGKDEDCALPAGAPAVVRLF